MTTDVSPGEKLGRYQLSRRLSSSEIAEVFLARAEGPAGFEKALVIKRVRPELVQNPEFVELFLSEARSAAQLDHPNCVQLFDFGEVAGTYFLAMEFVDGVTLRDVVEAAPGHALPLSLAARIVMAVCEGLACAHELGQVHGNVSPEHVMLAKNGGVKVIDFGVSRVANLVAGTAVGTVKGRVGYQPVEQLLAGPDLRADLYALGVMLYELGAGATPYPRLPEQQLFDAILSAPPVPLAQRVPGIDPAYAAIVDRAMARDAEHRYADCRELEGDLSDFIRSTGERVGTVQVAQLVAGGVGAVVLSPARRGAAQAVGEPVQLDDLEVSWSEAEPPAAPAPQPSPRSTPAVPPRVLEPSPGALTGTPLPSSSSPSVDVTGPAGPALPGGLFANIGRVAVAPARAPPPGGLFANIGRVAVAPTPSRPSAPARPAPAARASAPAPSPSPSPSPAPAVMDAEARAQAVLASAKAMRTYEAGPALGTPQELHAVRAEVERDEGALLLVRFALSAGRLLQASPELRELLAERLGGVVAGLLLAEAYTPLAGLLERLEAAAREDHDLAWVHETLRAALSTPEQVARLGARLRELAPADAAGLGRVIGQFGGELAPAWLTLYEAMELPGSREAMQPGLAALAAKNPAPFVQRVDVRRPRRLAEFSYFLERGRAPDRHRLFKELLAGGEPARRRDVLAGMARAGADDALRLVTQALGDADEESRIHAVQLLAKHFPDKAFALVQPLLDDGFDDRSLAERQALWRALGSTGHPDVLAGMAEVLRRKPTLLNRGKLEARKLDVLEGLVELKRPDVPSLLEAIGGDDSQPDAVRASAERLLVMVRTLRRTDEPSEARRWERTPSTWRDVLLDLAELADAARLLEATSPLLDVAFQRLQVRVESLLRVQSPAAFAVQAATVTVNGDSLSNTEGDAVLQRVVTAFASRGVTGFTLTAPPSLDELRQLVRWLAQGPGARAVHTPHVQRAWALGFELLPVLPPVQLPPVAEPSKAAMTRYAALVLELRGALTQRKAGAATAPPELRVLLHELAQLLHGRSVRFLGLAPATGAADALVFHTANTLLLALGFGAELGLSRERLAALAEWALYSDAGQLELVELLARGVPPSKEDLARARRVSLRLPFERQADAPAAVRWACIVVDQEKANGAEHGVLGDLVALARAWEGLTSNQSPEAALEALTTRLPARFRPELLALFVRFAKRQAWRPLPQRR